jgi:hypothetical protein
VNAPGSRRLLLAAVLAVAVLLGLGRSVPASSAAGTEPTIGALRICTNCVPTGGDLSRYHYVILNSWDAPLIPKLKAANPGLKALVYKNLTFTVDYTCKNGTDLPALTAGVGYCDANANHPDWFLKDTAGNRINSAGYSSHWAMDVGNAAYQDRWLGNVSSELKSNGWDGVFLDDTNMSMDWHLDGRTIARYPSDASWRSATRSMLANIGPTLQSQGFLVVANVYAPWKPDYDAQATWKDWLSLLSGASQEYYTKWGTSSSSWITGNDWTWRQGFQQLADAAGKIFLGIVYGPKSDVHTMQYARASFLLYDNGRGALMYEASDPEAQDPYAGGWTTDVGSPLGPAYKVGSAWRRDFTGGTVVVNPTTSPVSVPLGKSFLSTDGTSVSSVTLDAASGAVLTSPGSDGSGGGTPPPPPPPASITLTATASGDLAKLTWQGTSAAKIDVYRNGSRVARVANTGTTYDRPARRPSGTYTYRVCAAGTTTCSANASVTFTAAKLRSLADASAKKTTHRRAARRPAHRTHRATARHARPHVLRRG